jgi:hypothetical protein
VKLWQIPDELKECSVFFCDGFENEDAQDASYFAASDNMVNFSNVFSVIIIITLNSLT